MKQLPRRSRRKPAGSGKHRVAPADASRDASTVPSMRIAFLPGSPWSLAGWWLASFFFLLASNVFWLADRIPVWPIRDTSVLQAGNIYSPPLASLQTVADSTHWPYWRFAALAGLLYAWMGARLARNLHPIVPAAYIWTVCQFDTRGALLGGAALWAAFGLRDRLHNPTHKTDGSERIAWTPQLGPAAFPMACFIVSLLAAAVTIEFGLPLAIAGVALLEWAHDGDASGASIRSRVGWLIAWFGSVAIAMATVPGFSPALLRPLNWMWLHPPPSLLPSLAPLWDPTAPVTPVWHGGLLAFVAWQWYRTIRIPKGRLGNAFALSVATLLALGCVYYTWMAAILAAAIVLPDARIRAGRGGRRDVVPARKYRGSAIAVVAGLVLLLVRVATHSTTILSADVIQRRISPTDNATPGTVMLLNLDHARRWQTPALNSRFPLLLNDRWEVYASAYGEYLAICRDWKEWKREAYLRSDGTWGGYQAAFERWRPSLIAVDAEDAPTVRQVTLDSKWKIVGVDGEEVLFGSADDHRAVSQALRCLTLFSFLEIPRSAAQIDFEGSLALGAADDVVRVARVFNAMRMPLAALRVLPDARRTEVRTVRAMAYFELAHRTLRYSGRVSLLDSVRAQRLARDLLAGPLPSRHRRQITQARDALVRSAAQMLARMPATQTPPTPWEIRWRVIVGDLIGAEEALERLRDNDLRKLYRIVFRTDPTAPTAIRQAITATLQSVDLPPKTAAEFRFYAGSLALEAGDPLQAETEFQQCLASDPTTPLGDLARFYLAQMQASISMP